MLPSVRLYVAGPMNLIPLRGLGEGVELSFAYMLALPEEDESVC